MRCSLSASPEATSRHGIGESIGAYGTPSKRTWFRQAPLRKRTNRFRRMAKRWSKWTPPRVKKYKLPVKRNILASKAFSLLEGVVTPLSLSKRLLGAKEWVVFEPFAEWKKPARTSKRIFSPKACYTHAFPEISSLEIRSRFCYPENMHLLNHRPVLKNGSSWKLGHFFPYGYFNDGSSRFLTGGNELSSSWQMVPETFCHALRLPCTQTDAGACTWAARTRRQDSLPALISNRYLYK